MTFTIFVICLIPALFIFVGKDFDVVPLVTSQYWLLGELVIKCIAILLDWRQRSNILAL